MVMKMISYLKKILHATKNYWKKLHDVEIKRKKMFDTNKLETMPELHNESKQSQFISTSHDSD